MDSPHPINKLEKIGFTISSVKEISDYDRWLNNAAEFERLRRYWEASSCYLYLLNNYPKESFSIYRQMVSMEEQFAKWALEKGDWKDNNEHCLKAIDYLSYAGYSYRHYYRIKKRIVESFSRPS